MSSVFSTYIQLGFHHIFDLNAYDHMLFLLALSAIYTLSDWRKVIALVTSFTVGHSVTLALATFNIIQFDTALIEFLIPVTILLTCITNFFKLKGAAGKQNTILSLHNLMALFFGLIHGMGFAHSFAGTPLPRQDFLPALFSFNLGIEFGQLAVLAIAYGGAALVWNRRWYAAVVERPACVVIAVIGLFMAVQRIAGS